MKYTFDSKVRFSEAGLDRKLRLNALIDYFQDCSTFQSENIGLGLDHMKKIKKAWLLASWQVIINRLPIFDEDIIVTTWPYSIKNVYGMRNYTMDTIQDERLAYANSIWVLVDTESGKITRPDKEHLSHFELEPKLDMDYAPRKIRVKGEGKSLHSFYIENHHLDINGHVNNGQYVLMAQDCIPRDISISQLRVDYRTAAKAGDLIEPTLYEEEDSYIVELTNGNDKVFAIVEFK